MQTENPVFFIGSFAFINVLVYCKVTSGRNGELETSPRN